MGYHRQRPQLHCNGTIYHPISCSWTSLYQHTMNDKTYKNKKLYFLTVYLSVHETLLNKCNTDSQKKKIRLQHQILDTNLKRIWILNRSNNQNLRWSSPSVMTVKFRYYNSWLFHSDIFQKHFSEIKVLK